MLSELRRREVLKMLAFYVAGSWILIQVADLFFPGWCIPESSIRHVWVAVAMGLPVALLFSWYFDISRVGVRRTMSADRSVSSRALVKSDIGLLSVLSIVALGIVMVQGQTIVATRSCDPVVSSPQVFDPPAGSIAVLPFVNMSADPEQKYFSDGISTEIVTLLGKLSQMSVTPSTSSFTFQDRSMGTRSIAKALNVVYILDGAVRRDGDRVRITIELVNAPSDTLVWADSFDRQITEVIPTQYEIADAVVKQVLGELPSLPPIAVTIKPEAYDLYLRAEYLFKQWTGDALDKAAALYEQAITIEPQFVAARVRLADVESYRWAFGRDLSGESLYKSQYSLEEALRLDPDNSEAVALLGMIKIGLDRDFVAGARHLKEAQKLDPRNPYVIEKTGLLLWFLGRMQESTEVYEYLTSVDPVNSQLQVDLGLNYLCAGRFDQAIDAFETSLYLSPDNMQARHHIVKAWILKGSPDDALDFLESGRGSVSEPLRAMLSYALGDLDASDALLSESVDKFGDSHAWNIAQVFAFRGDRDRAFEWLKKAAARRDDPELLLAVSEPMFGSLRDDPRWLSFLDEIALSPQQLNKIDFHAALPEL